MVTLNREKGMIMSTDLKIAIEQVFIDMLKELDTCAPAEIYPCVDAQRIIVKRCQDEVHGLIYQDNENLSH
jgi:hypothetical protein